MGASRPPLSSPLREERGPLVGLAALAALLFADVLFRGRVLFERDIHSMWLGQVETFVSCVATGAWPTWDPYIGFGQPLWANPNNQVLYPFTWLNLLFPPLSVYVGLAVSHTLWGALGVYFLVRAIGGSRPACFVGGAVWMLSGPVVSVVSLWNHLTAAAWLPWSVLAADRATRTGSRKAVLGWSLALSAQVLAGSPDVLAMSLLASFGWALVVVRAAPLARRLGLALLAGSLALAISAAQWLPSVELAERTRRGDIPTAGRNVWAVHPLSLAQTVLPARLYMLPLQRADRDRLFEGRDPFFHSIYLGLASLALVAAGAWTTRGRLRVFLLLTLITAFLVALGRHTPLVDAVSTLLPPLRMLRYPAKAMLCVSLAWALLAALGYDAWRSGRTQHWLRTPLALLSLAAALLAGHVLLRPELWAQALLTMSDAKLDVLARLGSEAWRVAGAAGIGLGAVVAMAGAGARRAGLLAALVVADLLLAHHDLNPTAPRALLETPPATAAAAAAGPLTRVYSWDYHAYVPGRRYRRDVSDAVFTETDPVRPDEPELAAALRTQAFLVPQIQARWALRGSFDRDIVLLQSPQSQRLMRLLRFSEETPAALRLLQLASVDSVLALHTAGLESLEQVAEVPGYFSRSVGVFRVPGSLPPVYAAGRARVADDDAAVPLLLSEDFDPTSEVVLASGPPGGSPARIGSVRLLDTRPDRIVIEADLDDDGWLVTLEGYDPDWRASVDGRPVPVQRANLAFRAVPVPAGRHVIEQRYLPGSIGRGLAVSGFGVLALLGLAFVKRGA